MPADTEEMTPAEQWQALQDTGVAGWVADYLQRSAAHDAKIMDDHIAYLEGQIAELQDQNRRLSNRLCNAQRKFERMFWDERDMDWGA